jgi:hypothetical protein
MSWLITKKAPPSAAERYRHHDEHRKEFADGLAQVPITPPPAQLLLDIGAGHGAAGDAAVAAGLLAVDGQRFAVDHHAGFARSAFTRGAIFLSMSHLATLPIPRESVVTIVASHIAQQFGDEDDRAALDLDLAELAAFGARVLAQSSELWVVALEPPTSYRSADHVAGLISSQGYASRWGTSRPENQTPENGRLRWPKKFTVTHFPVPTTLVRLPDRTVLEASVVEMDAGFGHLSFERIDVPTFHRFVADAESGFAKTTVEYFVTQSAFEQILAELENRRTAVASANASNFAMIGWDAWD